jgi:NAD(P)-dependent dehydrogenase (short-subunit alcohol dehydrogenase family)
MKDKVALVTGSTSGIGRAIAGALARQGARVVIHGREEDLATRAVQELRGEGRDADAVVADLSDAAACRRIVQFTVERFGQIDILVNNAATLARGPLETASAELWDAVMAVNLRAPFLCLQEAVGFMKTRGGCIINVGSVNAYAGAPKLGPYSVSKGGLMTMTRNAAAALARHRIRVNQINPGWTLTEGERQIQRSEGKGDEWLDEAIATRPFGRLLAPDDIAAAAVYFASDEAGMISGAVLDVDQMSVFATT